MGCIILENSNNDNNRLIELLTLAKGDRSWNQYALNSGVDAGHLSRLRKENFIKPPKPDLLNRLAQKAYNGVTYEQLMIASGYLDPNNDNILTISGENLPQELKELDPEMAIQIVADNNGLSADDIKSFLEIAKKIKASMGGK